MPDQREERYARIFMTSLETCRRYKPKFGGGRKGSLSLQQFHELYGRDPFYSWLGMDSPLVYSAHRAAGGITSVYRQIGLACQLIVSEVLGDELGLTHDEVRWSYQVDRPGGKVASLSLDARIPRDAIRDPARRARISEWVVAAARQLRIDPGVAGVLKGAVFEVRQGYKSKDAKRQNADLANAAKAYSQGYLPVMLILSTQIDHDLLARYSQARWLVLQGELEGSPTSSTWAFFRSVIGYDLAGFFAGRSPQFRKELETILKEILTT